jgi:hypothetical protein
MHERSSNLAINCLKSLRLKSRAVPSCFCDEAYRSLFPVFGDILSKVVEA